MSGRRFTKLLHVREPQASQLWETPPIPSDFFILLLYCRGGWIDVTLGEGTQIACVSEILRVKMERESQLRSQLPSDFLSLMMKSNENFLPASQECVVVAPTTRSKINENWKENIFFIFSNVRFWLGAWRQRRRNLGDVMTSASFNRRRWYTKTNEATRQKKKENGYPHPPPHLWDTLIYIYFENQLKISMTK